MTVPVLPLPVLNIFTGRGWGEGLLFTNAEGWIEHVASPLTRIAKAIRPLPAKAWGRGEDQARRSCTIGGLALRPSTWKPATRL